MTRLPIAAPASTLQALEKGLKKRECEVCQVTWHGVEDDECWACHELGQNMGRY